MKIESWCRCFERRSECKHNLKSRVSFSVHSASHFGLVKLDDTHILMTHTIPLQMIFRAVCQSNTFTKVREETRRISYIYNSLAIAINKFEQLDQALAEILR
jgi:hypothetical protein